MHIADSNLLDFSIQSAPKTISPAPIRFDSCPHECRLEIKQKAQGMYFTALPYTETCTKGILECISCS
ncbi:hypothetical protein D3C81_2053460 [compost metagenome]